MTSKKSLLLLFICVAVPQQLQGAGLGLSTAPTAGSAAAAAGTPAAPVLHSAVFQAGRARGLASTPAAITGAIAAAIGGAATPAGAPSGFLAGQVAQIGAAIRDEGPKFWDALFDRGGTPEQIAARQEREAKLKAFIGDAIDGTFDQVAAVRQRAGRELNAGVRVDLLPAYRRLTRGLGNGVGLGYAAVVNRAGWATLRAALLYGAPSILITSGSSIGLFLLRIYVEKKIHELFSPKLVARSWRPRWFRSRPSVPTTNIRDELILNPELAQDIDFVTNMIINVKKHGGQFDHVLLEGEPGVGKTHGVRRIAQIMAAKFGMAYADIPAANVSQFLVQGGGAQALVQGTPVKELNALFTWAEGPPNGTLIFFDEAETFLGNRNNLDMARRDALNLFLAKTGTPSNQILVMAATNRKQDLDPAVLSRFGLKLHFPLPTLDERRQQLTKHIKDVFEEKRNLFVDVDGQGEAYLYEEPYVNYDHLQQPDVLTDLATRMEGLSGRTIQKFANQLYHIALSQDKLTVDKDLVNQTLRRIMDGEKKPATQKNT